MFNKLYRLFITKDPVMYTVLYIYQHLQLCLCIQYDVSGNVTLIWKIKLECPLLGVCSLQQVMFYFSLLAMSKNVKGTSLLVKVLL